MFFSNQRRKKNLIGIKKGGTNKKKVEKHCFNEKVTIFTMYTRYIRHNMCAKFIIVTLKTYLWMHDKFIIFYN